MTTLQSLLLTTTLVERDREILFFVDIISCYYCTFFTKRTQNEDERIGSLSRTDELRAYVR